RDTACTRQTGKFPGPDGARDGFGAPPVDPAWPVGKFPGHAMSVVTPTVAVMTNSDYPWEPPLAGTEAEHLVGALDRLRTTFRWKADDLDAAGLNTRVGASTLTIGGLLKHLARAEDQMFRTKLDGSPMSERWASAPWDTDEDWDFNSAANDTPERLYTLW